MGKILGILIWIVFLFLVVTFVAALFIALWKEEMGPLFPNQPQPRRKYLEDAVLVEYVYPFLSAAAMVITTHLLISQGWLRSFSIEPIPGLGSFLPSLSVLGTLSTTWLLLGISASLLLVLKKYLKQWRWVIAILLIVFLLAMAQNQRTWLAFKKLRPTP